jgi:pyruvate dehydrogenase E2 component (dihydrolipoamide acetyltransferase)
LLALRATINADATTKVTINDFIVKAAAGAMVRVPEMNVIWTGDAIRQFDSVDIAVAMDTERGLMTPVVRSVDSRSLTDVSAGVKDLASRASAGSLKQHELEGGSLTISNLGMFGVAEFSAIINPPQVGILAVGAAVAQPVVGADGAVEIGQVVTVVLSVDHRPADGVLAAKWLQHFKSLIENPLRILA